MTQSPLSIAFVVPLAAWSALARVLVRLRVAAGQAVPARGPLDQTTDAVAGAPRAGLPARSNAEGAIGGFHFCAHVGHQLDCTCVDLKLAAEQCSKLSTFGTRRMTTITSEEMETWPFS